MSDPNEFDAVIAGGGPVGAAAALELHRAGLRVLLVESRDVTAFPGDFRPLAVSHGSRLILERLGVDALIEDATEIRTIHISQRGRFGRVVMTAEEAGLPALGYVLDYASVVRALEDAVAAARIETVRGARVTSVAHGPVSARVEYECVSGAMGEQVQTHECIASIVAIADGNAAASGIDVRVIEYGQSAVSARVVLEMPHESVAYERFTTEGPLALLPFEDDYALVWTMPPERAVWLCSAAPGVFLARLQEAFGERAGRFLEARARAVHRVGLRVAAEGRAGRAVLIGNAAQTLHPVAGQGFNLGLRDAWELAEEVRRLGAASEALPDAYLARRRVDRGGGIAFTHALVKVFSNDSFLLGLARGLGLALFDTVPPAKDFLVRRMEFGARG